MSKKKTACNAALKPAKTISALMRLLLAFLVFFGSQTAQAESSKDEIIVSAAASLTNIMQELGKGFEQSHEGRKVVFNFGASGDLLAQMSQGAPVDIFISASPKQMDQAQEKGLIDQATRIIFAANILVLAKPATGSAQVTSLDDLRLPAVSRIGIGKPETVPAGQYAKDALAAAGLWDAVQPKLIVGSSVRQVLDYLRRGEVDCGLVYATDVRVAKDAVVTAAELTGTKVLYPAAITKGAKAKETAALFLEHLKSKATRAGLQKAGFLLP